MCVLMKCVYICGQHLKQCVLKQYHEQKWCECEVRLCHQKQETEVERLERIWGQNTSEGL